MTVRAMSGLSSENILDTKRVRKPMMVVSDGPAKKVEKAKESPVDSGKAEKVYTKVADEVRNGKEEKSSSNSQSLAQQHKVVKLTPPKLNDKTTWDKIYCTRPMRDGNFQISCEKVSDKLVAHCYGHGGSGPTTLFGSVQQAIEKFEKMNPKKDVPIRVIGAGVMGRTCAIELTRKGYKISQISAKELTDLPSYKAAGYFALVSVKTSKEEQDNLNEIGMNTFKAYQQMEKGEHPYLNKETVRFLPVYCSEDTESGVEDLEKRGMIPPREYVTLDFQNGTVHPKFVKFMTYFINTTSLMRQLTDKVKELNIPVVVEEITSFKDVKEDVIFNCAGLGGRELNSDDKMIAVRGHLIALDQKAGSEHMDYMIYTKVKQDGKERYVYMFPKDVSVTPEHPEGVKCKAVLGGTFIEHTDKLSPEKLKELDTKEMQDMLDRNSMFFTGKKYSKK